MKTSLITLDIRPANTPGWLAVWKNGEPEPRAVFESRHRIKSTMDQGEIYAIANQAAAAIGRPVYGIEHDRGWFFIHTEPDTDTE